jgi:hypothetical protein
MIHGQASIGRLYLLGVIACVMSGCVLFEGNEDGQEMSNWKHAPMTDGDVVNCIVSDDFPNLMLCANRGEMINAIKQYEAPKNKGYVAVEFESATLGSRHSYVDRLLGIINVHQNSLVGTVIIGCSISAYKPEDSYEVSEMKFSIEWRRGVVIVTPLEPYIVDGCIFGSDKTNEIRF